MRAGLYAPLREDFISRISTQKGGTAAPAILMSQRPLVMIRMRGI